jgi:Metallo-beta-lactamase superfamily
VQLIKSEAAKAPIAVYRLRGNIAVLAGSGGNIAVLTGRDGKVLVDAGIAVSRPQIATALAGLGPGAREYAQTSVDDARVADWDFDFPPLSAGALPTDVFATERTLKQNDTTMAREYYGPVHTDSDISVHFTEVDILHTGDTFWNGIYPFIDYSTGGSVDGSIRAADANLAATTDTTIIIPGHGQPVGNRSQLRDYRDMLVGIRENVAALKKQGRPLEDIVVAKPTAAYDAKWGNFVIDPALFTKLVFEGV